MKDYKELLEEKKVKVPAPKDTPKNVVKMYDDLCGMDIGHKDYKSTGNKIKKEGYWVSSTKGKYILKKLSDNPKKQPADFYA